MSDSSMQPPTRDWEALAKRMVKKQIASRGVKDERLLDAMRVLPRHRFAPMHGWDEAYADKALPIGSGQTISQPYIVARMTQLLQVKPGMRVLELGTGSGYQAAVLLAMGATLVTVERHAALAEDARALLSDLFPAAPCDVIVADGTAVSESVGVFDRILVTAGAPDLPASLRRQLKDPGRIVIPTGPRDTQVLMCHTLNRGVWTEQHDIACRFVPLVGEQGWDDEAV